MPYAIDLGMGITSMPVMGGASVSLPVAIFHTPLLKNLDETVGSQVGSFSRGTAGLANVPGFNGEISTVKDAEPRFGGVRRVENLLKETQYPAATSTGYVWWTRSWDTTYAPVDYIPSLGLRVGYFSTLDSVTSSSYVYVDLVLVVGQKYSFTFRAYHDGAVLSASPIWNASNSQIHDPLNVSDVATGSYKRYCVTFTPTATNVRLSIGYNTGGGGTNAASPVWTANFLFINDMQLEVRHGNLANTVGPSEHLFNSDADTRIALYDTEIESVRGATTPFEVTSSVNGTAIPGADQLGLLIESSATNLIPNSDNFSAWTVSTTLSSDFGVSPSGATDSDKISGLSTDFVGNAAVVISGTVYYYSCYMKNIDAASSEISSAIRLVGALAVTWTGSIPSVVGSGSGYVAGSAKAEQVGNTDWWRVSYAATASANGLANPKIVGNTGAGTKAVLIWGAQIETSRLTSLIKTSGATATRDVEALTYPDNSIVNANAGSAYAELNKVRDSNASAHSALGLASGIREGMLTVNSEIPSLLIGTRDTSPLFASYAVAETDPEVMIKAAVRWSNALNELQSGSEGNVSAIVTSAATMNVAGGLIHVGDGDVHRLNGFIRNAKIWGEDIGEATLKSLT